MIEQFYVSKTDRAVVVNSTERYEENEVGTLVFTTPAEEYIHLVVDRGVEPNVAQRLIEKEWSSFEVPVIRRPTARDFAALLK